jgi:hypothetical protein
MEISERLPELLELERLIERAAPVASVQTLAKIPHGKKDLPLYAISFGPSDKTLPIFGLIGGVHGLERIGTHVILSFLRTFIELLSWDKETQAMVEATRIVFIPLLNPVGMFRKIRSNGNGVDLMRNAPVEATDSRRWKVHYGHRISPRLPWYRGELGKPMEIESSALCRFIEEEFFQAKIAMTLDVHSGYGAVDRLWFPYAKSREPISHLAEAFALKDLLDRTFPHHVYQVEPQSQQYCTHGDLWDHLYDRRVSQEAPGVYLPLSLELGSWLWVKKNPTQMFSVLGAFNPVAPHRYQRILRRHLILIDFLQKTVRSPERWASLSVEDRRQARLRGLERWYEI